MSQENRKLKRARNDPPSFLETVLVLNVETMALLKTDHSDMKYIKAREDIYLKNERIDN